MEKRSILEKLPLDNFSVHCVGIGGIGVSAIAEILLEAGCKVSGSDSEYNDCCARLADLGAAVASAGHRKENLPDYELGGLVMSGAVSMNNEEVVTALRNRVMAWTRGEFLGELCRCYRRSVLVAGSHGKSSTTAMLGWILNKLNADAGLLLGAAFKDHTPGARLGNGDILVAEADESDGTIALLSGELALVVNADGDHAWNEAALQQQEHNFQRLARACRHTIYIDSPNCRRIFENMENVQALTAEDMNRIADLLPEHFIGYEKINAVLAAAGAEYLGFDLAAATAALRDYPGIARRQSEVFHSSRATVLEDYAHHPTELAASLEVIKARYPGHRLLIVFQPHRYLRLRKYFRDFVRILSEPDYNVLVMPVFSAWENAPVDALENSDLAAAINQAGGNASVIDRNYAESAGKAVELAAGFDTPVLIALIGAGDVNSLTPELIKILK